MTAPDEFEYEEELLLDDDLPQGFQVYESAEDYAADMEAEDNLYLEDDEEVQALIQQAYDRSHVPYD